MKICRVPGKDRRAEYALYSERGIVPLSKQMQSPPDDATLFVRMSELVSQLQSRTIAEQSWEPRPRPCSAA